MSVDINVLFASDVPDVDAAVSRLGDLLHIRFSRVDENGLIRYEYPGPGFELIAFGDHGFDSLVDGHRLSDFDIVVDCVATEPALDYAVADAIRMGIGMFIFRKLVATGHRAIILRDLQRLVEASNSQRIVG